MKYRTGVIGDRTIWCQIGSEPALDDRFVGLMERAEDARLVVAALERFWDEWRQPSIGDVWEPREDGLTLTIEDVRMDGKLVCSKDGGGATVRTAEDLNINYVLAG